MVQPASTCCFVCPLLWGVRMICWYTTMTGIGVTLNWATPPLQHVPEGEAAWVLNIQYMWWLINAWGILVGFKGLIGVKLGDPDRVRSMFLYYVVRILFEIPMTVVYMWAICDILVAFKEGVKSGQYHGPKHLPSCAEERKHIFQSFVFRMLLEACFAHACWSLACRFASGDMQGEDALLGGLRAPLVGDAAWVEPPPLAPTTQGRPQPKPQAFRPFAGTPHRLE